MAFMAVGQAAPAQETGSVAGVVVSTWDATPLAGVTVTVRGTTLAAQTDAGGRYQLNNVPPGEQVLRFSKSGFASAVVTEALVLIGQRSTVNGNLRPEFYEMEEYEVTAEEFTEQTERIFFDRQKSSTLLDAIGSDLFKNLAVSDAAGALSRVTGASVADGKYAVIRGLADRYTFTTMNGTELPSADPDRRAFQLDLFPAKFIEKMDVRKTFTPDMSGGFAGGSIDIVTKSYPEKFLFEFRVETAYNTQSSLRDDFPATDQGSRDWLAMDDGTRALPREAKEASPTGNQVLPADVKSAFKSTQLAPVESSSPLDSGFSLLFGDTQKLFGRRFGYLAGFNYKHEYRYHGNGKVRSFSTGTAIQNDKTEELGVIDYQWGGLANLTFELIEHHQLKFNFLYIQSAQDEARRLRGKLGDLTAGEGTYVDQSVLHWTERNLRYYQLAGEHEFPELHNVRFDWGAALSTTTQDEPDYRIFQFFADPETPFFNPETTAAQPTRPTRLWRDLQEDNLNMRMDLTVPLPSYNSKDNLVKAGAAMSASERDFNQRGFQYSRNRSTAFRHPFYQHGDPNEYLAGENIQYLNLQNFPVNLTYHGEQKVNAVYLMADWAAFEWLRLIGGARYETTDISITAENITNPGISPPDGHIKQNDLLPSLSAVVQLRDNVDLRAAWSRTVVRPTYREIAEVDIYDVTQNRTYSGNPGLEVSASENFDLRLSWYPRPGEILSLGAFAKKIRLPIELAAQDLENARIKYENFEEADVYGVEGELRLNLDRLWKPLTPFTVGFNGAYIQSEVPLTQEQFSNRSENYGDFSRTRPLYNQPAYILNGDLTWENRRWGTTVTLSGGVVGERLVLVGLARPDEFEQPAPELNLFIRQRLGKHWDVRFTAKNLLNPSHEIAQTWPTGGRQTLESHTKGITFGLSVGCEF